MKSIEEYSNSQNAPQSGDELVSSHIADAPSPKNKFSLANWKATNSKIRKTTLKVTFIDVRKPRTDEFVRTSLDPEKTYKADLIERAKTGELYLLHPDTAEEIRQLHSSEGKLLIPVRKSDLMLAVNRQEVPFIWRVVNDSENSWLASAANAAKAAQCRWVRMISNKDAKRYDYHEGLESPDPVWPEQTFDELVNIAFSGRIIGSMDHPFILELLGER